MEGYKTGEVKPFEKVEGDESWGTREAVKTNSSLLNHTGDKLPTHIPYAEWVQEPESPTQVSR
jgi:hypothetical protein